MKTNYLTFDDTVTLLKRNENRETDKYGNLKYSYEELEVFCNIKSIDRNQFYNASVQGYKLSFVILINEFEFNGASKVLLETQYSKEKEYEIIRTYKRDDGLLEIVIGEKIGVNEK